MYLLSFILLISFNVFSNIGTAGFKDYSNYYFVETGCFDGYGIQRALDTNSFKEIYSIEIQEEFVNDCINKFRNFNNVHIIKGDSKNALWDIIKNFDKKITFWLDAHIYPPIYDGIDGRKNAPLIEELEQIKKHHIKNHTILIDDMSCCGTLAFDYVTIDDLIKKIKEINSEYEISFIVGGNNDEVANNILVATVK